MDAIYSVLPMTFHHDGGDYIFSALEDNWSAFGYGSNTPSYDPFILTLPLHLPRYSTPPAGACCVLPTDISSAPGFPHSAMHKAIDCQLQPRACCVTISSALDFASDISCPACLACWTAPSSCVSMSPTTIFRTDIGFDLPHGFLDYASDTTQHFKPFHAAQHNMEPSHTRRSEPRAVPARSASVQN